MKASAVIIVPALAVLLAAGCAPSGDPSISVGTGEQAGFWKGLWHGFIVVFTFIVSLFRDGVGIYEVHNNGGWYDFGFVLGAMLFFGSSGGGACRRR